MENISSLPDLGKRNLATNRQLDGGPPSAPPPRTTTATTAAPDEPDSSPKEIPLSRGLVALVDLVDYEFAMGWKWYAQNDGYARRAA